MIAVHVASIGLCGPGMADWASGRAVLRGEAPFDGEHPKPAATILPPAERRRSGPATRIALQVAQEAMTQANFPPTQAAVVFASSDADGENLHHILESLAQAEHEVSPTRFHNSVHNAAAGYWNIATGARTGANSLAAFDASFAAGLLEAAVQVAAENIPVLLVAFDLPFPAPLNEARTITAPFAAALLLTPQATETSLARLQISLCDEQADTAMGSAELEALRKGNPAARALPLLQAIARGTGSPLPNPPPLAGEGAKEQGRRLSLNYGANSLVIEVEKA
ncbi:hypothetical protein SKTS_15050 [Sulfurimicrobium lacus]|uniref:Beta-ketoacyl synthase-like N-terminal domain-containing protein n=1 Tax=Sulfurimicrobium lacus TaxID=2715678 RepID=A0A6F8VD04_9PROT|nr:beta-ketoacyl synthase chain length factor [Sulfurimicrobium lacus]BCB26619.1 hypothetical protein SKTS_15050 [Sulfurimicrobium lacus]